MVSNGSELASLAAQSVATSNPNTPRSPTPDEPRTSKNKFNEATFFHKSFATDLKQDDIQSTWPKSIDLTRNPAVVVWHDRRLSNLDFDLHWHRGSQKAFFLLRTNVAIMGSGVRRDANLSIYIHIHPERIQHLSVDSNPEDKKLGPETVLLKFEMNRRPAFVVPKTSCKLKNDAAYEVMAACREVVKQTSFEVYSSIPRKKMSAKYMAELCVAVSDTRLASLTAHASTASLYQGTGGRIIEGDTLADTAHDSEDSFSVEPPPQYSQSSILESTLGASNDCGSALDTRSQTDAYSHHALAEGRKRRRMGDGIPEWTGFTKPTDFQAMETFLDFRLSSLKQHFDARLTSHRTEVKELVAQSEARILATVRSELDERRDGVHDDVVHIVRKEIAEVEENVMRNLSEAPMTATLTFPQHPWY